MSNNNRALLSAAAAGSLDALKQQLSNVKGEALAGVAGSKGQTPLHLAAAGGFDECVEALLEAEADPAALCAAKRTPLHCAAQSGIPMCAYLLASKAPGQCLQGDAKGVTPIQLAVAAEKGEVLNAMLLACSAHATPDALACLSALLDAGAVCDTWAPNGSSALMLAASVDCAEGVRLLLDHAASLELQDALGRTALMFAAGNNARAALEGLLDRGASVSIRDRRGRNVLDYAATDSEVRQVLEKRIAEMESKAARLQEELLAELLEGEGPQPGGKDKAGGGKKGKKKKGKGKDKEKPKAPAAAESAAAAAIAAGEEAAQPAAADDEAEQEEEEGQQQEAGDEWPSSSDVAAPTPAAQQPLAAPSPATAASEDEEEWQVVGRRKREEQAQQQQQQQQHLSQRHLESAAIPIRRCPSASSLGSSCSGESHDTAGSSQRSVLIPPLRLASAARSHLAAKQGQQQATVAAPQPLAVLRAAAIAGKPAWGKPAPAVAAQPAHSIGDDAAYPPLAAAVQPAAPAQQQQAQRPQQQVDAGSSQQQEVPAKAEQQPAHGPCSSTAEPAVPALPLGLAAAASALPASLPGTPPQEEEDAGPSGQHGSSGAEVAALGAEVAALRAEVARLRLQQQRMEAAHQEELASVLEDTAAHEAAAVTQAVASERLSCIYRFAAFLQNNHLADGLLAGHHLTAAARGGLPCAASAPLHVPAAPALAASAPAASGLDYFSLGFPPLDERRGGRSAPKPVGGGGLAAQLAASAGASLGTSPEPSSFCFADLEQRLRTEFSGDVSRFVVPASEAAGEAPPAPAPLPLPVAQL